MFRQVSVLLTSRSWQISRMGSQRQVTDWFARRDPDRPSSPLGMPALPFKPKRPPLPKRGPGRPPRSKPAALAAEDQSAQQLQQDAAAKQKQQQQSQQQNAPAIFLKLEVLQGTTTLPWKDTRQVHVQVQLRVLKGGGRSCHLYSDDQKQHALSFHRLSQGSALTAARHILLHSAMFFPADVTVQQLERNIGRWADVERAEELMADIQERHENSKRGRKPLVPTELVDEVRHPAARKPGYQNMQNRHSEQHSGQLFVWKTSPDSLQ